MSSSALRAQITAERLTKKLDYNGKIHYMNELYTSDPETIINILSLQDDDDKSIFIIGHNPELTELGNILTDEKISKLPTSGVLAINFNIDNWEDINDQKGELDFMIYPNLFKYYMPKQIRTTWAKKEN